MLVEGMVQVDGGAERSGDLEAFTDCRPSYLVGTITPSPMQRRNNPLTYERDEQGKDMPANCVA